VRRQAHAQRPLVRDRPEPGTPDHRPAAWSGTSTARARWMASGLSNGQQVFSASTAPVVTDFPSLSASGSRLIVPEGGQDRDLPRHLTPPPALPRPFIASARSPRPLLPMPALPPPRRPRRHCQANSHQHHHSRLFVRNTRLSGAVSQVYPVLCSKEHANLRSPSYLRTGGSA